MPYTPGVWADDDPAKPLSAARMTNIETGVAAAQNDATGDVTLASDTDVSGAGDIILKTGGVERARISATGTGSGLLVSSLPPKANSIMVVGDSISANGYSLADTANGVFGRIGNGLTSTQGYLFWASLISQGRLQFAGVAATSGYTAAQILSTHVPTVVAKKPAMCVVLAGTNDISVTTFSTWTATMTSIYQTLLNAGTLPIACTLPPRGDLSGVDSNITKFNVWIKRNAQVMKIPCVDFYGALASDSGGYASGMNLDTLHPSVLGARTMGQLLWDKISPTIPPFEPYLSQDQPTTDTTRQLGNSLFLTDTNADGIPDLWNYSAGTGTPSLAVDTATFGARSGKIWSIVATTTNQVYYQTNALGPFTPGNKVWFAIKFQSAGFQANNATIDLRLCSSDQASDLFSLFQFNPLDTTVNPVYVMAGEVTMPAGYASNQLIVRAAVRNNNGGSATSATLKLAQPTVIDLTAAGIA